MEEEKNGGAQQKQDSCFEHDFVKCETRGRSIKLTHAVSEPMRDPVTVSHPVRNYPRVEDARTRVFRCDRGLSRKTYVAVLAAIHRKFLDETKDHEIAVYEEIPLYPESVNGGVTILFYTHFQNGSSLVHEALRWIRFLIMMIVVAAGNRTSLLYTCTQEPNRRGEVGD